MGINNQLIHSMGMTLVHSLWEGALVAVVVLFALSLIQKGNARLRYVVLTSGLLVLFAGFLATFLIIYSRHFSMKIPSGVFPATLLPDLPTTEASRVWQPRSGIFPEKLLQWLEPAYPYLAISWLLGFFMVSLRTLGGIFMSRRLVRKSVSRATPSLQAVFDQTASILKVSKKVHLRVSTQMIGPMVFGFVKPVVVVPLAAISGLGAGQIEAIFYHELAHIRRYDHVFIIIQALIMQVLFFHPLAWFLSAEIDRERENCCDDLVIKKSNNPVTYIKALTMIQEMNLTGPVQANALLGNSKRLLNRVRRLVKPELKHSPAFRLTVIFLLFITLGITAVALTVNTDIKTGLLLKKQSPETSASPAVVLDTSRTVIKDVTMDTEVIDSKGEVKKKVRIIVENDTVREITVNGKKVPPSEMDDYMDEIRNMQSDMESSGRELRHAEMELERARMELEKARQEVEQARQNVYRKHLSELNGQLRPLLEEGQASLDEFRLRNGKKIQEHMALVHKELQRSHEQLQSDLWQLREKDWEKYRKEWGKAMEKMKPAFEEFRQNWNDSLRFIVKPPLVPYAPKIPPAFPPFPPFPPAPDFDLNDVPHINELEIEIEKHEELNREASPEQDVNLDQSLDSKLRELEESKE
ncbi:MAG TPA: M56 family metallopeptidase [Bacteroidales bacterium]|nr:M56 family metallopeptidase [Bacteroidales bacterium]